MPARPAKRVLAQSWLQIPGACCPIGGGLVKLGHGSNLAALVVGTAPYAICALLCCLFGIGYLFATIRYLCTGRPQQEFIEISANAMVSIIALTPTPSAGPAGHSRPLPARQRAGGMTVNPSLGKSPPSVLDG